MNTESILAEREITRQVVRFARAMDDRDWDALRSIMLSDVTAELGTGNLDGPDAVVDLIRSFLDHCGATQHLLGNILVDVDLEAGTATSAAYVSDLHLGTGSLEGQPFYTLGDYHDQWTLTERGWRMSHRTKMMSGFQGNIDVLRPPSARGRSLTAEQESTAIAEIGQLKAKYFRLMDTKDWASLAELFTDNVVVDMTQAGGAVTTSRGAYVDLLRSTLDGVATVHHGHTPEVVVESESSASGVWAMEDMLWWPEGSAMKSLHGFGHYHDEYRKIHGAWRIDAMRLTRIRQETR
ncbi:nuclear transport factor 2 family protein [Gordonia McavH-238-E]|uniref:nuclear transport factor 2 family protein n=1 Tax=Gordonia sp. McavH-238-E TaxID=2917736 RepID=UPI001EF3D6F5|nr:nuclear transport factor 2 family protein [Gordonia sp. McavH-238-E]MCG7631862.1 nuclear transport factor 2 family protein [Gordonia sp. McavH-238-E]